MTSERDGGDCGRFRDDLLLLACGDVEPSACSHEWLEHLAACPECRVALLETRETVAILATALKPEPLCADLQSAILSPIVRTTGVARPARLTPLHGIGFAAAAGLILALMLPVNDGWTRAAPLRLSADDERELVAAYAVLQWDTPVDFAIERVSEIIDEVYGSIEHDSNAASILPWGPDDEWDAPVGQESPSSRGWPLPGSVHVSFFKLERNGDGSGGQLLRNGA